MDTPGAYIPMDRRRALARCAELPDRADGTALFADISGFTPLTEALARALGPRRGAEELTHHLNLVYDALIAEVDHYGGSVIGFAGDAITCWLDGDDGARATACGLAMQAAMRRFAAVPIPSGDPVALAAKVAVATGPARRFVVGDPEIQRIDVLAGATLERMVAAEHLAAKGEVVLDEPTAARAGAALRVAEWRVEDGTGRRFAAATGLARPVAWTPLPPLPPDALSEDQTRPWLLPPIFERLHSGQGDFLAELRPVAVLFLGFRGIDYDADPHAPGLLDAYVRWVQQVLARYGGYLLQIIIGDKGSYLYAAFGAPIAHDDDAARAMAAALELRTAPPTLGYSADVRIGVAAGRVFTGAYGGAIQRTYGALGDAVNLAARLMQHATSGGILVGDGARKAAAHGFTWQSLPPLTVKGKADPVAVYGLVGAAKRHAAHAQQSSYVLPMVGREAELALVDRTIEQALTGRGQILAITAEAGLGKSRLVAETIRRAGARGLDIYVGECQSYGAHNSYLVWEGIWRAFFGLEGVDASDEQARILEARLAAIDPALVPRLPLLGVALNLPIPDNDLTASLDAKLRKDSLEALLVDCLRAQARSTPLLLVLEDCHWIDPLSRDLIEAIGRVTADVPVLLVAAYRPPEAGQPQAPRIEQFPHCTVVPLTSFTGEEAERLITLKLGRLVGDGAAPATRLVERITEQAQGNPFYIEELLNYLHDRAIDPRDPRALEGLELPASLHSLILSRIDRLSESQKTTIKIASVIGRQFRMDWLWGVYPSLGAPARVRSDLETLSGLDLTPLDQPEPEYVYLFKHIVTREVAYESLPYARRALLHGQLGGFVEGAYAGALDQYVDLLAYHYDLSGVAPKKREYLRRAGDAAQAAYANAAAIDYYRRLLPLLDEAEQSPALLRLGQVLELVGDWSEASDRYRQALQLAEELDDRHGQAACQRAMGWLLRKQGECREASSWLEQARTSFERLSELAAVSQVMTDMGEVSRLLGAYAEAKKWYDDALSLAASVEEREPRLIAQAQALKGAGTLAAKQGDNATARTLYEESLAMRRELGDRPSVAVLLNNLGIVARYMEDYAMAWNMNEESLAVLREIGDRFAASQLLNNLGCVAADMGDYVMARRLLAESVDIQRQLGDKGCLAIALNSLGDVLLDEEDHMAARPLLMESLAINVDMGDRAAIAYLLDDFAALATAEGQPGRALRLAGAAAAAHDAIGSQLPAGERARFDRLQAPARQALGEHLSMAVWGEGRAMTLEQAVEYALAGQTGIRAEDDGGHSVEKGVAAASSR